MKITIEIDTDRDGDSAPEAALAGASLRYVAAIKDFSLYLDELAKALPKIARHKLLEKIASDFAEHFGRLPGMDIV